jgi:hypothetical protein
MNLGSKGNTCEPSPSISSGRHGRSYAVNFRGGTLGAGGAGAEVAGEGSGGGGEGEIEAEAEGDAGEQDAGAELGDGEHVECGLSGGAGLRGDGGVQLGEEGGELLVGLCGGVEDEALKDETDGVECGGGGEDDEAGEQAEAGSEAGGDAGEAVAGAVDAEHHDGCGDEPEEGEQRDGRKSEGEKGERGGDGSGEGGDLDGSAPDDCVGGCGWERGWVGGGVGGGLLGADLLVELLAELFGELYLGGPAVPAEDEGALIFAMEHGVAAGADAWSHSSEG